METQSPRPRATVLCYPGVDLGITLHDAHAIKTALGHVIAGWVPHEADTVDPLARRSVVHGGNAGFATRSSYLNETMQGLGLAGAVCAVIADLAQDFFEIRPDCIALHCAAFRFRGQLIAMTGPRRMGKSTLAARLTQEPDMQVFCDDVLPVLADGRAFSLGIAPRLRLPLPATASAAFRAHVERHLGPCDDRYGYLCAPNLATHGSRAPLSVVLILDRRDTAPARLHHEAEGAALHLLLSQTMSNLQTADAAFARLTDLLDRIICLRLVYSDLEEAVELIRQAFGSAAPVATEVYIGPVLQQINAGALPRADMPAALCWSRNPEVIVQTKGDSAFLWLPGKSRIWHMNLLARAVWTLLEIPGTARDIGQLLAEHFPDTGETALIGDVTALLQALSADGLVEQATSE